MSLSEIINISGKPGLYRIVAQSPSRVIVQSLVDGKKMPVFMRHNFSILDDIRLYTDEGEMPLDEAFTKIYEFEGGKETISTKSSDKELADHLTKIIPSYDKEEVSHRDMKKLFNWYNILLTKADWKPESEKDKSGKGEEE